MSRDIYVTMINLISEENLVRYQAPLDESLTFSINKNRMEIMDI
jgi:hypothetical protein